MEPLWIQIADVGAQLLIGIGAGMIALVTYANARSTARLDAWRNYLDGWGRINQYIIERDDVREALVSGRPPADASEARKLDSILFIYLNQAELAIQSHKSGVLTWKELQSELASIWGDIVEHGDRAIHLSSGTAFSRVALDAFKKLKSGK